MSLLTDNITRMIYSFFVHQTYLGHQFSFIKHYKVYIHPYLAIEDKEVKNCKR